MKNSQAFLDTYEAPSAPETGAMSRALYYLGAAPFEAAKGLINSGSQIATGEKAIEDPSYQLAPAQSWQQSGVDLALGGLLPYGMQIAAGGAVMRAAPGVAALARTAPIAAKSVIGAGSFGYAGAQEGRDVGIEQVIEGAVLGPIEALPRIKRLLPAAALALGSREFFNQKYPEPVVGGFTAGDITGLANFVLPMLPGVKKANARVIHNDPTPAPPAAAPAPDPMLFPGAYAQGDAPLRPGAYAPDDMAFGPATPGPAAESAMAMQQAQIDRLQRLQNSGLMPLQNPNLSPAELRLKQNLALGNVFAPSVPGVNPWVTAAQGVDPNAPIPMGHDPARFAPGLPTSSPSAIVPYQGGAAQPDVRMLSPFYQAMGITEPPRDFAVATALEGQKPNQALQMAMLSHEVSQADIARRTAFVDFTTGAAEMPTTTILPGSDPWAEMLGKSGSKAIDQFDATGLKQKLAELRLLREEMLREYDPLVEGDPVAGISKAITQLERQLGEKPVRVRRDLRTDGAFADPELINALGGGALRGGIGATVGGLFGANDNSPDTDPRVLAALGFAAGAAGPAALRRGVGDLQRLTDLFRKAGSESGAIGGSGRRRPIPQPAFKLADGTIVTKENAGGHYAVELTDEQWAKQPESGFIKPTADGRYIPTEDAWMSREMAHEYGKEISPEYKALTENEHYQKMAGPEWQTKLDSSELRVVDGQERFPGEADLASVAKTKLEQADAARMKRGELPSEGGAIDSAGGRRPNEYRPAIKVAGEEVVGELGDTHQDIFKRFVKQFPEKEADALMDFDSKTNPNYFKRGSESLSREQLRSELGVSDSQGLQRLQNEGKVIDSGIVDHKVQEFAETFREKLTAKGEEMRARTAATGLKKGNLITSVSTGRKYEYLGDAPTPVKGAGAGKPRIYIRDPFDGSESSLYHEGVEELGGLGKGKGMKRGSKEAGIITDEVRAALGRASIGGVIGMAAGARMDDPGSHDNMLALATVGALGAAFGPSLVRAIATRKLAMPNAPSTYDLGEMIAKARLSTFQGSDSLSDKAVVRMDRWFGLSKDNTLKRMLGYAKGAAGEHLAKMDDSFRKISEYNVDADVQKKTNEFLTGDLTADEFKVAINANGNMKMESYANYAITARESLDGLIEVSTRGLGNSKRAEMMQKSKGAYLRQSHRLFLDKYTPSPSVTQALAEKIVNKELWGKGQNVTHIMEELRQYAKEVQETKGIYAPREGKNIDQTLFIHRKKLDAEMKAFLGEITNPIERINLTVLKLRPLAEASDFMAQVAKGTKTDDGLPHMFGSREERDVLRKQLESSLSAASEGERGSIQKKINELDQYQYVKPSARYGELRDKLVHRSVYDVLNEWDDATGVDSAWQRALLGVNQMMKANVTYRIPLSIMRQIVTMPFFMLMGRAKYEYVAEALQAMKDPSHALHTELIQRGIINVDAISRDVYRELDTMSQGMMTISTTEGSKAWLGNMDRQFATVANRAKKLDLKMADWFRTPDNVVRIATYLSAKTRFAKEMGLALEDPLVANRAVEFTNRYTMNYEHLPMAIKKGSAVPGMNLFLSYTYEIARITKNFAEDMVKGDALGGPGARMNAVKSLGALVALPLAMVEIGESNLSEKDRQDWYTTKKNLPGYARNRFFFVTGRDPKTKQFNYIDFTALVPVDSFLQTARGLANGDFKAALATNPIFGLDNSPVMNIAASMITQRNVHTNVRFRNAGDAIASAAQEIGGPLTPGSGLAEGSIWRYLRQATTPNAEGSLGVTDKNGRTLTPQDLIPWAIGARSGSYSMDAQQSRAVAEFKQSIADEMYYLNQVLKSNTNDEAKEAAKTRTKTAVIALQRLLANKLGIKSVEP